MDEAGAGARGMATFIGDVHDGALQLPPEVRAALARGGVRRVRVVIEPVEDEPAGTEDVARVQKVSRATAAAALRSFGAGSPDLRERVGGAAECA